MLAYALNTLGVVLHRTGRAAEARAVHNRAIEINRRIDDPFHEALNHANLGHIEIESGRPESALVASRAALRIASRVGASLLAAWMLSEIASSLLERREAGEAAVLIGASESHIDAIGAHRGPAAHQSWHERTVERLRSELGDAAYERRRDEGAALSINDAIERSLSA